jgi:adenosylhomocysteinase
VVHRAGPALARRSGPNMILDDGGDATMLVHKGREYELAGVVPEPTDDDSDEWKVVLRAPQARVAKEPSRWTDVAAGIKGVTEETTTGVHRLYQMFEAGELLFPAINVNDSVTKSKFDNLYGCRTLADRRHQPRHRRHDRRQGRVRGRLRRRRQGLRPVAARPGRPRDRHRGRPDLCAAGRHGGLPGGPLEDVLDTADIFITTTGNKGIITAEHMARMKHQAIVANIGHFDNEIDMAGLAKMSDVRNVEIKPQVNEFQFPDGHSVIVLAEGRLMNLGCATGHPSFVMSNSFTNQADRPDRAVHQDRRLPARRVHAAQGARREGGPTPPRRPGRPPHRAHPRAGRRTSAYRYGR